MAWLQCLVLTALLAQACQAASVSTAFSFQDFLLNDQGGDFDDHATALCNYRLAYQEAYRPGDPPLTDEECHDLDEGEIYYPTMVIEQLTIDLEEQIASSPDPARRKKRGTSIDFANPDLVVFQWNTDNEIPVHINAAFNDEELDRIEQAIAIVEQNSCFQFGELDFNTVQVNDIDRIVFTDFGATLEERICFAFVGRNVIPTVTTIAENQINLEDHSCFTDGHGTALRLLFATLGALPEQARVDRDLRVTVNLTHVPTRFQTNYQAGNPLLFFSNTPYDYNSIMHSSRSPFAPDAFDTVVPLDELYIQGMGSSTDPTFLDLLQLNTENCASTCSDAGISVDCGLGFQNPADCNTCICPDGYGGVGCTLVAELFTNPDQPCQQNDVDITSTNGNRLIATSEEQCISSYNHESTPDRAFYTSPAACNFILQTELPQCQVQARFDGTFNLPDDLYGTCQHYVELKYLLDQTLGGPRFCGESLADDDKSGFFAGSRWLESEGNTMPVIFNGQLDTGVTPHAGFNLCYRQICPFDTTLEPTTEPPTTETPTTEAITTARPFNITADCQTIATNWGTGCETQTLDLCPTTLQTRVHTGCMYEGVCSRVPERRACGTCTEFIEGEPTCRVFYDDICYLPGPAGPPIGVEQCCNTPLTTTSIPFIDVTAIVDDDAINCA